jgi:hypothetical protein
LCAKKPETSEIVATTTQKFYAQSCTVYRLIIISFAFKILDSLRAFFERKNAELANYYAAIFFFFFLFRLTSNFVVVGLTSKTVYNLLKYTHRAIMLTLLAKRYYRIKMINQ